ncbi:hypothetical protein DY251_12625 [Mesorhizobium denitrificans]|uniref:Uncharacterized protein n=1 Tax=Mesorhizobium denitrificans TaxID=2294114 RepID=A0A371XDS8_9HYPH|nr:hypothetical protein DY251_12625 [Mesorhizobium denitrificans]
MPRKIEVSPLSRAARLGEKAQATDNVSRSIVDAETKKRDAKTERLRAARLKAEAETPVLLATKQPRKK